jgi:hypothetical protein
VIDRAQLDHEMRGAREAGYVISRLEVSIGVCHPPQRER